MNRKRLVFTVTNDLLYDQRMIRICTSLQKAGYEVLLVGRKNKHFKPLLPQAFQQKRLYCFFQKGKKFYVEYNIRLFFFLLFQKFDLICAIDLDTILPCYYISKIRNKKRVYDAHELFCEMKEVASRPKIYKVWKSIERKTILHFKYGYTVNTHIQQILHKEYGVQYEVIRNMPLLQNTTNTSPERNYILYQGAVNEGRSFETLIPAFQYIDLPLWICGNGNFFNEAVALVKQYGLESKVVFKGKIVPGELKHITQNAFLGVTLFEKDSLNNYYSLANRFFDYMQAGVPQLCVHYPAYAAINQQYKVAVLIDDLSPQNIATHINHIISDTTLWKEMHHACLQARTVYNWQHEEQKLISYYKKIFED